MVGYFSLFIKCIDYRTYIWIKIFAVGYILDITHYNKQTNYVKSHTIIRLNIFVRTFLLYMNLLCIYVRYYTNILIS
jgi:hypothetical protein